MVKKLFWLSIVLLFAVNVSNAQTEAPKHADEIMKAAYKEAKAADKNIFLIFHATWCGWCKRLEKAMQSNELKKIFEDNFVIVHLDVDERGEKIKEFENPGGKELMAKLGGEKSGLPFYAFLTSAGAKLSDSNVMENNQNIGYPGSKEEIEAFTKLLSGASIKLDENQIEAVTDYLVQNAPKPAPAAH